MKLTRDEELFQLISRALNNMGISAFLLVGLREEKTRKDAGGAMLPFFCISAEDKADFGATLGDVFLNTPGARTFVLGMAYQICRAERKTLEELAGEGAGAHQPIAKA